MSSEPHCQWHLKWIIYWGHEEVSAIISNLVLNRLNCDEIIINDVCTLIKIHDKKIKSTVNDIKLVVDSIGKTNFERLLKLQTSDVSAHLNEYAKIIFPKLNRLKEVYINNNF